MNVDSPEQEIRTAGTCCSSNNKSCGLKAGQTCPSRVRTMEMRNQRVASAAVALAIFATSSSPLRQALLSAIKSSAHLRSASLSSLSKGTSPALFQIDCPASRVSRHPCQQRPSSSPVWPMSIHIQTIVLIKCPLLLPRRRRLHNRFRISVSDLLEEAQHLTVI